MLHQKARLGLGGPKAGSASQTRKETVYVAHADLISMSHIGP